jgi:hypothetical protein
MGEFAKAAACGCHPEMDTKTYGVDRQAVPNILSRLHYIHPSPGLPSRFERPLSTDNAEPPTGLIF